jgi:hypothetical protein
MQVQSSRVLLRTTSCSLTVTRFGARKASDQEPRSMNQSVGRQPKAIFGTQVLPTSEKCS